MCVLLLISSLFSFWWNQGSKHEEGMNRITTIDFILIIIITIIILGIPMKLKARVQERKPREEFRSEEKIMSRKEIFVRIQRMFVVSWVHGHLLTQLTIRNLPFILSHPFFGFWDVPLYTFNSYFLSLQFILLPPCPSSLFNIDKRVEKISLVYKGNSSCNPQACTNFGCQPQQSRVTSYSFFKLSTTVFHV